MFRALIASSLISFGAHAAYLDTVCSSALQNPSVAFGDGVVSARMTDETGTHYVLSSLDGNKITDSDVRLKAVVVTGDNLWFLTGGAIVNMKKDGTVISSYQLDQNITMTQAGNLLLVVRNGGTLTAFDMTAQKEVWTSYLSEISGGDAVAVAFDGKNAQVVLTSNREGGYNGLATVDITNGKVIKAIPYDVQRSGVIDPDAKVRWYNNSLVINNGGWIHVITADQLAKGKPVKPRWVAHALGEGMDKHYMMLKGEFFFEGNSLVGCGLYNERQNGEWVRLSKLFKVTMP